MTKESKTQSDIIKELEKPGTIVIDLIQTNRPGIPDLLRLTKTRIMPGDIPPEGIEICVASGIEVKRDGESRKPHQKDESRTLRLRAGLETVVMGPTGVMDDSDEVEAYIEF